MAPGCIDRLHWDSATPGITVRLISGGPLMTTDEVYPNGTVQCCWFVDGHLHRDSFFPEQLMHALIEQKA